MNGNGNGIDLLALLLEFYQIFLAYKNIDLNNQQIKMLMSEMRDKQDKMLAEIKEQNEILIQQNNEILELLRNITK